MGWQTQSRAPPLGALAEVLEGVLRSSLDGCAVLVLVPVGRADFTVLVGELEGLDQTEGLFNGATDRKIVDAARLYIITD